MKHTLLALTLLSAAACGESSDSPDAAPPPPDAMPAPDSDPGCEPTAALPFEWRPIDEVSTGQINLVTNATGTTSGTIDATAGGTAAAADNPYIYIDLQNNTKVDITDVDAYTQSAWDIAFKRYVILANGGDSGPGNVAVAFVAATSLPDVTTVPPENQFATDDWSDPA